MLTAGRRGLRIKRHRQALYTVAQHKLMDLIRNGRLLPGAQLPAQDDLAEMLGVSRATVREAIRGIAQLGLIEQRHGVGTFVTSAGWLIDEGMEVLESLESIAKRQGWRCGSEGLGIQQATDSAVAERFGLPAGTPINAVTRVKTADDTPIASMTDYVPETALPIELLSRQFTGSVLDMLLLRQDPAIDYATATLTACSADNDIAGQLRVPPGTPLLFSVETVYGKDHRVVEMGETYFVTQFFRFHVIRRPVMFHGSESEA